jgi:hypothetical protein
LINEIRNSFAGSTTTEGQQRSDKDIENLLSHPNFELKGISIDSQVSFAFYSTKQTPPPTQVDDEGGSISPLYF